MLPPETAELLNAAGHDATTPARLGAHNLPDEVLAQLAAADGRVIVTENAADFAAVTTCPVLLIRKAWWPAGSLAPKLAAALDRWGSANRQPGPWLHWLPTELRLATGQLHTVRADTAAAGCTLDATASNIAFSPIYPDTGSPPDHAELVRMTITWPSG